MLKNLITKISAFHPLLSTFTGADLQLSGADLQLSGADLQLSDADFQLSGTGLLQSIAGNLLNTGKE